VLQEVQPALLGLMDGPVRLSLTQTRSGWL